jgi:predicted GNAT superfamily acetyltransferase
MRVWGIQPVATIPWSQMHVVARNGGVILGAYLGSRLIGFVFSQPGWDGKRAFLYSKMLGVDPDFQGLGIGRSLKRRQRRAALDQGYRRVVWTFDPLERASALLNIGYLGVVCRTFHVDFYGPDGVGGMHAGLPSDRLVAEWEIGSERAARRARRRTIPKGLPASRTTVLLEGRDAGTPRLETVVRLPALVMIPPAIQEMKQRDAARARAWQSALRGALSGGLRAGGEIPDVVRVGAGADARVCYLITPTRRRGRGGSR